MISSDQRLFDIRAAVEYLRGIGATSATPNFIRRIIATGEVPHLKIGKKPFVSRVSLDGWLQRHERDPSKVLWAQFAPLWCSRFRGFASRRNRRRREYPGVSSCAPVTLTWTSRSLNDF
jgi:hypothetical protein